MDSASEEISLQKLEELVFDEDKIVTISILCQKLDVSIPEGKYVLDKFISNQKLGTGKISVTYIISGTLKNGLRGIQIVDELALKDKKELYAKITDEVVYSVQKNNSIDFNLIALAEKSQSSETTLRGSIVGENCNECTVKTKILPPLPPQKNFEKQKPSSSFFKPVQKGDKKSPQCEVTKNAKIGIKAQKKAGGLGNFLASGSEKRKLETEVETNKEQSSTESVDEVKIKNTKDTSKELDEIAIDKLAKDDEPENHNQENKKVVNKEIKSNKKDSKKNSSKKKGQDGKKRKRIVMESDSEDDLFGNDEDEQMEVAESDEEKPETVKQKEPSTPIPKNKRRKAVDKTYEDEDGYIVTKTEYVLVSASEDEENSEPVEKKEKISNPKQNKAENKSPPPAKNNAKSKKGKALGANQTTLMNFFKKK